MTKNIIIYLVVFLVVSQLSVILNIEWRALNGEIDKNYHYNRLFSTKENYSSNALDCSICWPSLHYYFTEYDRRQPCRSRCGGPLKPWQWIFSIIFTHFTILLFSLLFSKFPRFIDAIAYWRD